MKITLIRFKSFIKSNTLCIEIYGYYKQEKWFLNKVNYKLTPYALLMQRASMSTAETRGLSIKWRDKVPGEVLVVKIMLLSGLGAHITNRSLEKPHSISGTLTKTA